jgi:hypothetical protein
MQTCLFCPSFCISSGPLDDWKAMGGAQSGETTDEGASTGCLRLSPRLGLARDRRSTSSHPAELAGQQSYAAELSCVTHCRRSSRVVVLLRPAELPRGRSRTRRPQLAKLAHGGALADGGAPARRPTELLCGAWRRSCGTRQSSHASGLSRPAELATTPVTSRLVCGARAMAQWLASAAARRSCCRQEGKRSSIASLLLENNIYGSRTFLLCAT